MEPGAAWLKCYLGGKTFAGIRLVATGDHDGKGDYVREMVLTHFVDDRAVTCNVLVREEGIRPIVYEQPWNRGKHSLDSVESWQAIKKMCSQTGL